MNSFDLGGYLVPVVILLIGIYFGYSSYKKKKNDPSQPR